MANSSNPRFADLPLNVRFRVDELCTSFESSWRKGDRPSLEHFLDRVDGAYRPALLSELLPLELEYRRRFGESPSDGEYNDRFPSMREVVQEAFAAAPADLSPQVQPRGLHRANEGPPPQTGTESRRPAWPRLESIERRLPKVEGYDVLAEIGKGGMGVVFKARHLALNRIVALKMILSAEFATTEELIRFMIEGEMLARLNHPNIVHVFEVGRQDGNPFIALEYVAGGTLADFLKDHSLPVREAAALVELLACAVHHAHLNGIIHRDLKPANVLLDHAPSAGPSLGNPKIADFGLARPVAGSPSLTTSGMVIGTPEFMAPEQAKGEKNLGPTVDVYALGAILYRAVTGCAPFRADTPLETIQHVLEKEPVRPRQLRPDIPADLETICLKCLEKEPSRRYATTAALADDLRRWLDGRPITARAVGLLERTWKWSKRRPALAASFAAIAVLLLAVVVIPSIAAVQLRREQERTRHADRERRIAMVRPLLTAAPDSVPYILKEFESSMDLAVPILRRHFSDPDSDFIVRLRAAVGLTAFRDPQIDFLLDSIPIAPAAESRNLVAALRAVQSPELIARLRHRAQTAPGLAVPVRYAILLLELGDVPIAQSLLAATADPNPRSAFIDAFETWHGDLSTLSELLRTNDDPSFRSGLCSALARVDPATIPKEVRQTIVETLSDLYRTAPDGGTHSACDLALRRWAAPRPQLDASSRPAAERQWFVNRVGTTMIGVSPGALIAAPDSVTLLTKSFFISDREVSVADFRRFLNDREDPSSEKPKGWPGHDRQASPQDDCPINNVSREEMFLFCNWVSVRDGRRPCYHRSPLGWKWDTSADGYRLPTEAEWDYAHRAGASSTFFFGENDQWFSSYARVCAVRTAPARSYLPNRWGLFDMVGNLWEMCWDYFADERPRGVVMDPLGPNSGEFWVLRGGAYDSGSYDTRISNRFRTGGRQISVGFRIVCSDRGFDAQPEATVALIEGCTRAIESMPNSSQLIRFRGELFARATRWQDAAADFSRLVDLEPANEWDAFRCATLLLYSGDIAEYRRHCSRMLERFGNTSDPGIAERTAKACLLAADAPVDLQAIEALNRRALAQGEKHPLFKYFELARGMAGYRARQFDAALDWLQKSQMAASRPLDSRNLVLATLFEAMAHQQLRQTVQAREAFDRANRLFEKDRLELEQGACDPRWHDIVINLIVFREAEALLRPPK
jgi:formylglycine-generating enzyme required for sulfatase activity/tRNA A-37 threonylcarbamoyl transferase component Bud32